jgi:hypothetical protein
MHSYIHIIVNQYVYAYMHTIYIYIYTHTQTSHHRWKSQYTANMCLYMSMYI